MLVSAPFLRSSVLGVLALAAAIPARALDLQRSRCATSLEGEETPGFVPFPQGDVFCPLVADPKATRTYASYLFGEFPRSTGARNVASIGIGDSFALFRRNGDGPGDGLQVEVEAGVHAQFDLDHGNGLVNADYVLGLPVTRRWGSFSARARIYHQSSHLGDDFLLRAEDLGREDLSFESIELILSQELGPLRLYAGGEFLFNRTPSALAPLLTHGGAELRIAAAEGARVVAALDVKTSEQQEWRPAWSARAGVEFLLSGTPGYLPRLWSILVEAYEGPSPYGQFFLEQIRYIGFGIHFEL
jgi:hypothetical protein